MRRSGSAFLHFFDLHFLEERHVDVAAEAVINEAVLATRMALLLCDRVVVPAASYGESSLCEAVIDELDAFFDEGRVVLSGSGSSHEEFRESKFAQYPKRSPQHERYLKQRKHRQPPFQSRTRSAGDDIVADWLSHAERGRVPELLSRVPDLRPNIEQRWADVPELLDGRAFIVEHVGPLLDPTLVDSLRFRNSLHSVINPSYFGSYQRDVRARVVTDLVWLAGAELLGGTGRPIRYRTLRDRLRRDGLLAELLLLDGAALHEAEQRGRFDDALLDRRPLGDRTTTRARKLSVPQALIVHGRTQTRYELRDLLGRWQIDADFLDKQPNQGRTVIEKFEQTAEQVETAFVLIEPDDVGRLNVDGTEEQLRTRQNVIFEMGWFMGAFGRLSGRVIVLEDRSQGKIEWLSDLAGLVVIGYTGPIESISEQLRRELELD